MGSNRAIRTFFHEKFNVEAKITKTAANKYIARITNKGNTVDASMGVADAPGSRLALDRMNKTQTYLSKGVGQPYEQGKES